MAYCSKCGAQMAEDAKFCPSCGQEVGTPVERARRREKSEKSEKSEKQEKGEKDEKHEKGEGDITGALVGGLIVILLGSLLMLLNQDYITDDDFGSYFLIGIGAILLLAGLWRQVSGRKAVTGFLIGGAILMAFGVGNVTGYEGWSGAIILVIIGVIIIFWGISTTRKNPKPP